MWFAFVLYIVLFQGGLGDLIVQIKDGKVNGTTIHTPSGQTFYAWRGIPFGNPPVGNLRFLPPQKAEPWAGIRDASRDSPACIFFATFWADPAPLSGNSEDCLYINVYSPVQVGSHSRIRSPLPVMFWIYGGGFVSGTGDFGFTDPTPFLEENVIVVTFNYRLGTLGFLSTADEVILGNAGLKDQVLALKWTRDNIAFFGGNPSDITIFGESAGSGSVGYHIISPVSRNLFKAAIMESGSALFGALQTDPRDSAYTLASKIDSSITNASTTAEVRDVLQAADANLIVNLTTQSVRPVIEVKSDLSFITKPLYETVECGDIARVPTIMGYTAEESIAFMNGINATRLQASEYDANPERLVPAGIRLKENANTKIIGEKIRQEYVGKNGSFAENLPAYLDWFSDNIFLRHIHKQAILQCKYAPVYMYQFSYDGTLSNNHTVIPGVSNVGHTDEVGYLFNISSRPIKTQADYLARKRLVKLWTNFAKTTNPTPNDNSATLLQNVKWQPITQDNLHYLDIDNNLQIKPNRKLGKNTFWAYIWHNYVQRPYITY